MGKLEYIWKKKITKPKQTKTTKQNPKPKNNLGIVCILAVDMTLSVWSPLKFTDDSLTKAVRLLLLALQTLMQSLVSCPGQDLALMLPMKHAFYPGVFPTLTPQSLVTD